MIVRSITRLVPVCLILGAAVVAGCGTAPSAAGQQAAAAVVTPEPSLPPVDNPLHIPAGFVGTWTSNITSGTSSHGVWRLRISADDMELLNPVAHSDSDYFTLHPRSASDTVLSLFADGDCPAALYDWALAGGTLALTAIDDSCEDRHDVLTSGPWTPLATPAAS